MKQVKDLKIEEMEQLLTAIHKILYLNEACGHPEYPDFTKYWDPDIEWSSDHLDLIAAQFSNHGLVPEKAEPIDLGKAELWQSRD